MMNNLVDFDSSVTPSITAPPRSARPLLLLFGSQNYVLAIVTRIMILALGAMSLDLLIGYGAMISFGHAAFVGLGAYSVAILASHGITDGFVQLAVALGVALVFALFTGAISLRTKGVYFI